MGKEPQASSDAELRPRPVLYSLVVISAAVAVFAYGLRTEGIFACPAASYSSDQYLAYCNSLAYGDYDHGAFWFDLEPNATKFATAADVMFVGNSRMQFAFSTAATKEWFDATERSYYLLGFSHTENSAFVAPLLSTLQPRASVYIVNVDRFFDDHETPPAAEILHGAGTESRYRRKRFWQEPHRVVCGAIPRLCGHELTFFRARSDGRWRFAGADDLVGSGVGNGPPTDQESWARYERQATEFLASLHADPGCIIFTIVPTQQTRHAEASAIAASVGYDLVAPDFEDLRLRTFDGSHLDPPSAQRWSQRFFDVAGPLIRKCLDRTAGGASDSLNRLAGPRRSD